MDAYSLCSSAMTGKPNKHCIQQPVTCKVMDGQFKSLSFAECTGHLIPTPKG